MIAALTITGIGMTLLFLALAFFYGLAALMTATVKDRPAAGALPVQQDEGSREEELLIQAAVIAVALARAEAEQGFDFVGVPAREEEAAPGLVSPWWALHHQRQLALHSNKRRGS